MSIIQTRGLALRVQRDTDAALFKSLRRSEHSIGTSVHTSHFLRLLILVTIIMLGIFGDLIRNNIESIRKDIITLIIKVKIKDNIKTVVTLYFNLITFYHVK